MRNWTLLPFHCNQVPNEAEKSLVWIRWFCQNRINPNFFMKVWPCNFIIYNRRPFTDDHPYSQQDQNKTCVNSRLTLTQLKKEVKFSLPSEVIDFWHYQMIYGDKLKKWRIFRNSSLIISWRLCHNQGLIQS